MLTIDKDTKQINITRGDHATFVISAENEEGSLYMFQPGDVVRFKVLKVRDCNCVEIEKDVEVKTQTETVDIELTKNDTTINKFINRPISYWYEVELNPSVRPQTIIGYDKDGEKKFVIYPEGANKQ